MMSNGRRRVAPPIDPDDVGAASAAALHILNGASQSAQGLTTRLMRRGFSESAAQTAVVRMQGYGYVDDGQLATSVAARRQRGGYGRTRIAADLRSRGIDADVVDSTLTALDQNNEVEVALGAARQRWRTPADRGEQDAQRRRMAGFLQRRGFSSAVVAAVLRSLESGLGEEE